MTSFNVWIRDLGNKQEIKGKDLALKHNVLRKIYGPTKEDGVKRIKHKQEIRGNKMDRDAEVRRKRLFKYAGHSLKREEGSA